MTRGVPIKKELALNFDGKPNLWKYYEKGQLVRKERDTKGAGRVDTWEYWEGGKIDRIGVDTDGDGVVGPVDQAGPPPGARSTARQASSSRRVETWSRWRALSPRDSFPSWHLTAQGSPVCRCRCEG